MSDSEQGGRCRKQLEAWYANNTSSVPRYSWMIAAALDRLAADVAAVMEMTREIALRVPSEFGQDACDVAVRVALKERDAAVRERDEARAEVERLRAEVERLRAEVERLTARLGDRAEVQQAQLSAAFTEGTLQAGDAMRARFEQVEKERDEARAEAERLKAEFAARSAADVQPIGWIARHEHAPPVGKYVMCRWDVEERQGYARQVSYGAAKRGPDGMWRSPTGVEKIAPMHWMPLPPGVKGGDEWEQQTPAAPQPAAPPAGWLTDEERRVLQNHAESLREQRFALGRGGGLVDSVNGLLKREADLIDAMLARAGSPPVVALPTVFQRSLLGDELVALAQVKDAMDAAGVAWKEEPRE